jgi:antitoxin component YwqK of YwqJK toxin-antitoxin module
MTILPAAARNRVLLLLGALAVGMAAVIWWASRRPPASLPEKPLAELIKVEGRFVLRNDPNQPLTGWVTERYASGGLRSRTAVADGRLHGVSEGWHTNGVRQVEEHFVDGTSEGLVTKWHANGVKLSEGTARAGKFEGMFRRWHEDGQLAEELVLQAGQPEGVARSWFPSGSLKAEVTLKSGRVLTQKFWKDGEQVAEPVLAEAGGAR